MLSFSEAEQELMKLANGRYCVTSYSRANEPGVGCKPECLVYIHNLQYSKGQTFEEALNGLRAKMDLDPVYYEPTQEPEV